MPRDSLFPADVSDRIHHCGVAAVLVVDDAEFAVPLARALLAGDLDVMELTLRTPAAIEALRRIRDEVPEMVAGIGTVLTPAQVHEASDAGAAFAVAPGMNPNVVREAGEVGLPFAPGIVTASDLEAALELGCRDMKFFPAEPSGGIAYLKSLAAPYAHLDVRYIPLGGLSEANMRTYLAESVVLAIGGSWIAPRDLIQQQDWQEITNRAMRARQVVQEARGGSNA